MAILQNLRIIWTEKKIKRGDQLPAVLKPILITFLACLAVQVWPSAIFLWAIIWGIAMLLTGYYMGLGRLLVLFGSNALFLLLLGGKSVSIELLAFYAIPVLIAAVLLNRGKSYYTLMGWALLATVVSVGLYMGLSYIYIGNEGINDLKAGINATAQNSMKWADQSGLMQFYEQRGISRAEMKQAYTSLAHDMFIFTPAILCLQALMAVYLIIYLASLWARKKQMPILERRPFSEEIMPWQLSWVVIAGLACWLLGRDQMNWLYYSGTNILAVLAPITIFYGIAQLGYWLKRWPAKNKKWIVTLVILVSLIFTVPTIIFIGLIGLFDSLLDYRKLRRKKEGI